jgi:NAD(P)-dependent dehydrogenase (short-subunit alcohol dehydrogenase family)
MTDMRRFAADVMARYSRLDVLINNVGLLETERRLTIDGIEAHFAVNVLAPFLLTRQLLPLLQASAPARVINLSGGVPFGGIDLDNLQAEKSFRGLTTYSHAKQAMMAMTVEFAERLRGSGVSINVAFPGSAATPMTAAMTADTLPAAMRLFYPIFKSVMRPDNGESAAKAARSSIFLASSPDVEGITGAYYDTNSNRSRFPAHALDTRNRAAIWALCERLAAEAVGV